VSTASRSCGIARCPRFSSQRSPIANCLNPFLSWPMGSLRARLRRSAARFLMGGIECLFMVLPPHATNNFRVINPSPSYFVGTPADSNFK
jgi:hypothetical protein